MQVVRFGGDLTLVAIGGETVVDYSLRLKRELAGPSVWVAGYSNDVFTYLPSARVLQEGGYEAGGASKWGSLPGPFTADGRRTGRGESPGTGPQADRTAAGRHRPEPVAIGEASVILHGPSACPERSIIPPEIEDGTYSYY